MLFSSKQMGFLTLLAITMVSLIIAVFSLWSGNVGMLFASVITCGAGIKMMFGPVKLHSHSSYR